MSSCKIRNKVVCRDALNVNTQGVSRLLVFISSFGFFASVSGPAWAYVDPGVGGMLVQLLLGGVAGLAVIMRLYWEKVVNFWCKLCGKTPPSVTRNDDESL